MKKIVVIFLLVVHNYYAQQVFFTPLIGGKFNVSRSGKSDFPNNYVIQFEQKKISFMKSMILGVKLGLTFKKRHNINMGFIFNDKANSQLNYSFLAAIGGKEVLIEKKIETGVNLLKIPVSYNYKLWWDKLEKFSFSFHTGFNVLVLPDWNNFKKANDNGITYMLVEDVPSGGNLKVQSFSLNGASIINRNIFFSIDFGFNFETQITPKRSIITSIYYEYGLTKYISGNTITFVYNNNAPFNITNASTGSGIHFKLLFPILLKN